MTVKLAIGAALAGAFALGATVVAISSAQDSSSAPVSTPPQKDVSSSFSQMEEEEIRGIVYDYLMSNPEVIIEAVNAFSARERQLAEVRARENAKANLAALVDPKNGYVAGKNPENAKVTVIELFDYHCSFCKRAAPLMKEMAENDEDIKVVFRELPILREESDYAAEMSLAARDQGKFLDLHFALMKASGVLTKDRVHDFAQKQGLDLNKMQKARQQASVPAAIIETHELAAEMGVEGTPAFIVASADGSYVDVVQGFRPQELVKKIEAAKQAMN